MERPRLQDSRFKPLPNAGGVAADSPGSDEVRGPPGAPIPNEARTLKGCEGLHPTTTDPHPRSSLTPHPVHPAHPVFPNTHPSRPSCPSCLPQHSPSRPSCPSCPAPTLTHPVHPAHPVSPNTHPSRPSPPHFFPPIPIVFSCSRTIFLAMATSAAPSPAFFGCTSNAVLQSSAPGRYPRSSHKRFSKSARCPAP